MARLFSDSASGVLASPITAVDTVITLSSGQGANFPTPTGADYSILTLEDVAGNQEKVQLDDRVGDVLTVVRGAESSTPLVFAAGDRCELRWTASAVTLMIQAVDQTIANTWTFSVNLQLENLIALEGENVAGGTFHDLIQIDASDVVQVGDAAVATNILGTAITFAVGPVADTFEADAGGATAAVMLNPPSGVTIDVAAVVGAWKRGTVLLDGATILGGAGFKGSAPTVSESYHIGFGTNWDTNGLAIFDDGTLEMDGFTVWTADSDGTGSGLDADLLDGEEGDYFAGLNDGLATQDPDAAAAPTIYTNHANTPDGGTQYWHITTTFFTTRDATADRAQIAVQGTGAAALIYTRRYTAGAWSAWQQPADQVAQDGIAKAWCLMNGDTGANLAAYNLVGTHTSTGRYLFTFTNPMADANYVVGVTTEQQSGTTETIHFVRDGTRSAASFHVENENNSGSNRNVRFVHVVVFGTLA